MSESLATTPTPQAWCRSILTALKQRDVQSREAGQMEVLLISLIEIDPTPEAFEGLLARYAASARPGIAEAAANVESAWHRARAAVPVTRPSLPETLRVLGAILDESGARAAYLAVRPDVAVVQTCGPDPQQRRLGPQELAQESAARTVLRGQVPVDDVIASERHEPRLRVVGAVLAEQPLQTFELVVGRRVVEASGSEGYARVFLAEELAGLIHAAASQHWADEQGAQQA